MAWPFSGNSGGNKSADQNLSEERLKILANVAIEQVPFPEQGNAHRRGCVDHFPRSNTGSDQQPTERPQRGGHACAGTHAGALSPRYGGHVRS